MTLKTKAAMSKEPSYLKKAHKSQYLSFCFFFFQPHKYHLQWSQEINWLIYRTMSFLDAHEIRNQNVPF